MNPYQNRFSRCITKKFWWAIALAGFSFFPACVKSETQEEKSATPKTVQQEQIAKEPLKTAQSQEVPAQNDNQDVARADTAQMDPLQTDAPQADTVQIDEADKRDSNESVPTKTTDSTESASTITKIDSANKFVFETIKSWKPIFESCVPADYKDEIYIRLEYTNKGKLRELQKRRGNLEAYNCIKEKIQDFYFNIDVEIETNQLDICHEDYGIIALKYSNHQISLGYDTKGIGWKYTKCYCSKENKKCYTDGQEFPYGTLKNRKR